MKRLTRWLLCCLMVLLGAVSVRAADFTVPSLDVSAAVDRYGSYAVTAAVELNLSAAQDAVRLPLGSGVSKVTLQGGDYATETVSGVTWVVLKNPGAGGHAYTIRYSKTKTLATNKDGTQTVAVELVSSLWTQGAQKFTGSVTLPKEFSAEPVFRSGYYGEAMAVSSAREGQTITVSAVNPLLDKESVQVGLTLPANYFKVRHVTGGTASFDLVLLGLLAALGAAYWYLTLRNPLPGRQLRRLSPDGVAAWEYPYARCGGAPDPALLVSEWACLGYVNVRLTRRGRVELEARMPMSNERRPVEVKTFSALFRRSAVCRGDTPRFRAIGARASAAAKRYWNRRLFTANSGSPAILHAMAALAYGLTWLYTADSFVPAWSLRALILVPVLALGVLAGRALLRSVLELARREQAPLWPGALALAATAALAQFGKGWPAALMGFAFVGLSAAATFRGGRRSARGRELENQAEAFRRYLRRVDTHHLQLILHEDSQYFYDVLPYAEALGLGKRLAKRFANIQMEPCDWLQAEDRRYRTAMEFYEIYRELLRKMRGIPGASNGRS